MQNNTNRYLWVDIAKGVGIILVVYGHVLRGLMSADIITTEKILLESDKFVYSFHMPLFFILSGLFFTKSLVKRSSNGLLIEKIKTILYPYILWSFLQTSIEFFLSNYTNGNISYDSLLTCIIQPRAQFWFLFALFFINIINILCHIISKKNWLYISTTLGIISIIFINILGLDMGVFNRTFLNLIYFNIGIFASQYLLLEKNDSKYTKPFFIILILFILLEYFYIQYGLYIYILLALVGSTLVVQIAKILSKISYINLGLSELGKCSLEIYILHILVGSGTRIVLLKIFNISSVAIHLSIGISMGILVPYLFFKIFSSKKWFKYLFRL